MFMASFIAAADSYAGELKEVPAGAPDIPNTNFDTGGAVVPGEYSLADETYADLLDRLARAQFKDTPPEMRADMLHYYADTSISFTTKRNPKEWARVLIELDAMKIAQPAAEPSTTASRF
jgi:hypothetical protein